MEAKKHRHVFIGGLHRSGTSLLFRILRENPAISAFCFPGGVPREHEGQHLQSVYPNDNIHGGPGYFGFKNAAHLTEASDLVCEQNRQQLLNDWRPYWEMEKTYLLEKSPANLIQMRFLQALFNDTVFIVILRHPIAVSLATLKWMGWPAYTLTHGKYSDSVAVRPAVPEDVKDFNSSPQLMTESMLFSLMKHWERCHTIMVEDLTMLNNVVVIRYEDLVATPEATIQALSSQIGIPESAFPECIKISNRNIPYFQQWAELRDSVLSPEAESYLSSRFKSTFELFGYGFEDSLVTEWSQQEI